MVKGGSLDRFLSDVKTEVDAIDSFPEIAEDPVVKQINLTDQVISIAITGPMAEADLKEFAEQIKDRLTRLPEISQVDIQGFSERQIRIAVDPVALRQYGLSVFDIASVVERQSVDLPSGTVETRVVSFVEGLSAAPALPEVAREPAPFGCVERPGCQQPQVFGALLTPHSNSLLPAGGTGRS